MKLENGRFLMQVEEKGAEITSLYDKAREKELIWDGDPAFWARHAPILFPHVGRTFGDVLRLAAGSIQAPSTALPGTGCSKPKNWGMGRRALPCGTMRKR